MASKPKTAKCCVYNSDWSKLIECIQESTLGKHALCTLCKKDFHIGAGGVNDVRRHAEGSKHK